MREIDFDANQIDCWMHLASAICATGVKENDTRFLESDWFDYLQTNIAEWDKLRNRKQNISYLQR